VFVGGSAAHGKKNIQYSMFNAQFSRRFQNRSHLRIEHWALNIENLNGLLQPKDILPQNDPPSTLSLTPFTFPKNFPL
jgi:hypothetical protein